MYQSPFSKTLNIQGLKKKQVSFGDVDTLEKKKKTLTKKKKTTTTKKKR
tara:strand:+ start:311 stop:457 length:147 start_codon:yes stop_codon:yes gene_type:complete